MFSEQDIGYAYSQQLLAGGRAFLKQGRVLTAVLAADGEFASGHVQASETKRYQIQIQIHYRKRATGVRTEFSDHCTCPEGGHCRHVVAVLLKVLATCPDVPEKVTDAIDAAEKALLDWLKRLDTASQEASSSGNDYPDTIRNRLMYVLSVNDRRYGRPTAMLTLYTVYQTKTGGMGSQVSEARASVLVNGTAPKHFRPIDKTLLGLLWAANTTAGLANAYDDGKYRLVGELCPEIMRLVLDSGRGRWATLHGKTLIPGPPRAGLARWESTSGGDQRFKLDIAGGNAQVLPLPAPWYIVPETGETGPLETTVPAEMLPVLLAAPVVPAPLATRMRLELGRRLPGHAEILPQTFGATVTRKLKPIPCLRLGRRTRYDYLLDMVKTSLHALVSFDYSGVIVSPTDQRTEVIVSEGETLVVIPRNRAAERTMQALLLSLDFTSAEIDAGYFLIPGPDDPRATLGDLDVIIGFVHQVVPRLRADGWRVELDETVSWQFTEAADDAWLAEVKSDESSGIDWFGLSLGVTVNGERIDLLPVLLPILRALPENGDLSSFDALSENGIALFAPIGANRMLSLPPERVKPLLLALYELYRVGGIGDDGSIKLNIARAAELAEMAAAAAAAGLRWFGGERLLEVGRRLRDFSGIEAAPVPRGLTGTLRHYQQEGVNWLQFLRDFNLAGILADDMGLGKTIQTLSHILIEHEAGRLDRPALVVAPTSLMTNWRLEAARFAPSLRVLTLHGSTRKDSFANIGDYDLVLTTYPLLYRDKETLLAVEWYLLILDEAQVIKNAKSQAALIAQQLHARHRLCLTGTPMENNLGELWSLFHFLMPGLLGEHKHFQHLFRTPIEKRGDSRRQQDLARRVRPFLLRRTKQQVAAELPEN